MASAYDKIIMQNKTINKQEYCSKANLAVLTVYLKLQISSDDMH